MSRRLTILLLVTLLAACQPAVAPPRPASIPRLTPAVGQPIAPMTIVSTAPPTRKPASPTPDATQSAPASAGLGGAGSSAIAATPVAVKTVIPELDWEEWGVYEQALRPAARQGLNLQGLTQYHLLVELAPDLGSLHGVAYIHYTNRSPGPLDSIYLHLYPNLYQDGMTVSEVQAGGKPAATGLESEDTLLRVTLPSPLPAGSAADISVSFTTPIPNEDRGNFGEMAYLDDVLALAHFYPTVAVYDSVAGWHRETPSELGDVLFNEASLYDVVLTAPASLTVAATGATLGRTNGGDGRVTWRLAGGPMRDFNITASPHFDKASRQVGDVTINSYYLPADAEGGKQALQWAAGAFAVYQTDFGAYPYTELDVVETATSAGGIEYPGLVVIADRYYSDPQQAQSFEGATTHEVGHQWWYNVVGNDQVNAPWLDESLTQYTTYLYFENAYGQRGALGFRNSLDARWQRVNREQVPIGLPVADYVDPKEYSAIVYGRGPLFFLAVEARVGRTKMLEFLKQYYDKYAWAIATPAEFQALLQQVTGEDLTPLFEEWVYPKK